MIFVAVDIGGTFTDLIGFDDQRQAFAQAKTLSTPAELTAGVINCIRESGLDASKIDEFIHGSTIAINTLIERNGARTGLVVTRHALRLHHRPRQSPGILQSFLSSPPAFGKSPINPGSDRTRPGRR